VAFSSNGEQLLTADNTARSASGSEDGTATIWDIASARKLAVLRGNTGEVEDAAFSPDGTRVLTAGANGRTIIWSTVTDAPVQVLPGKAPVGSAAFNRSGTLVLTAAGESAFVWNASDGRLLRTLSDPSVVRGLGVNTAAFSPNGSEIVTANSDGTAIIWNASSAKPLFVLHGDTATVNSAAFSPDGRQVVTASQDHRAIIWSAATGKKLETLEGHGGAVLDAQFSPNGVKLVTAEANGSAIIWDLASGLPLTALQVGVANPHLDGGANPVAGAVFSPDGQELATISIGAVLVRGEAESVELWSTETSGQIHALEQLAEVRITSGFTPLQRRTLLAGIGG
jgi:WD40 repeat protein